MEKSAAAENSPRQWGALTALLFGAVAFVGSQVVVSELFYLSHWHPSANAASFYQYGLASLCTLALLSVFLRRHNATFRDLGLGKFKLSYAGYALLSVPVYIILSGIATAIAQRYVPNFNVDQQQDIGFTHAAGVVPLVMVFISLVIVPPIVEELLFRGLIFRGFLKKFHPIVSGLATSLIFGAAHWQWNVSVDVFALSLVLCSLAYQTKSLWPGICLHATKNFIAYFFVFIMTPSQFQNFILTHIHLL